MDNKIILYHGTDCDFNHFDLNKSKNTIDFEKGMYLTEDYEMACCCAAGKIENQTIKTYEFIYNTDLKIYNFKADKEWLDFVIHNRKNTAIDPFYNQFDILIGPTADDRLFETIGLYLNDYIDTDEAIKRINIANYSIQIVFKSQRAIDCLRHLKDEKLSLFEVDYYRQISSKIRSQSDKKINNMKNTYKKGDDRDGRE